MSNLSQRILVSLIGIPVLLWCAHRQHPSLIGLILLLQIGSLLEWRAMWSASGIHIKTIPVLFAIFGISTILIGEFQPIMIGIGLFLVALWLILTVFSNQEMRSQALGLAALFVIWCALPFGLWYWIAAAGSTEYSTAGPLGMLFVATWFCDSGAYIVGRLFGRHKLSPDISPHKTVEGAAGGLIFAGLPLLFASLLGWAKPTIADLIAVTIAVGLFGQAGDLLESLFKREAGLKDSSRLIPGHGGLLDRFDSLLISTPVFAAYLLIAK